MERKEDGSPPETPSPFGSIQVNYDGNLSEKMEWNYDKLSDWSKLCDLRSSIVVSKGNDRFKEDYSQLGTTAIFKRSNTHDESTTHDSQYYTVREQLNHGKVDIEMHDQVITHDALAKDGNDRFDTTFTAIFEKQFRGALKDSLWIEKKKQILESGALTGLHAGLTIPAGFLGSYLFSNGLGDFVLQISNTAVPQFVETGAIFNEYLIDYIKSILGVVLLLESASAGYSWFKEFKDIDEASRYYNSPNDLNPFKHAFDYAKGVVYVELQRDDLVSIGGV